ncbi:Efflux ABC transporter, permease/ATP-binding protein [hydrothermal vent metagenome]|uniref:Efflux ABC transporter, permease/ATP-binding protein n=1 Tax=hydrothermal vent metagenome TaxID=652676 RepID=A0A3B0TL56_9ZZZZ
MDKNLFRYIWTHSRAEQLRVLVVVLISFPFMFLALDLPKSIVNGPIQGQGFEQPGAVATWLALHLPIPGPLQGRFGQEVMIFSGFEMERLDYLLALSLSFLALVCINGLFKFYINSYKGRMGERMLRRLRYQLVDRLLRFPIHHFRKVRSSEIATMVKDEVEPLGGFIGDAFVSPVFLGGQAAVALIFIMIQDYMLGGFAAAIILIQSFLIPRLRRRLLQLGKERQLTARELAGRVGEIVDGVVEVHINDTSNYERADITRQLGRIFWIRYEIFQRKFFIKFLNNFLAQVTPFVFYLLGGYLAIRGTLDIGQLVAVIAAYKDLPSPIKELIDWDQRRLDVQIKYDQVVDQFAPEGMFPVELQKPIRGPIDPLTGEVKAQRLNVLDEFGSKLVENASFSFDIGEFVGVTGPINSGGESVSETLARLHAPSSGRLTIGGKDIGELPEAITGRRMAYVGPEVYLQPKSVAENLLYGLRHVPMDASARNEAGAIERQRRVDEAARAGNLTLDPDAEWTDYGSAGAADKEEVYERIIEALNVVGLDEDIYEFGLRGTIDPTEKPELAAQIVRVRQALRSRIGSSQLSQLVAPFDLATYNRQATIGENLLFGTPVGATFATENLATNPYILKVLDLVALHGPLLEMGQRIAATVVELFADLPPDHPFFEQVSFMSADDLPDYDAVVKRTSASSLANASDEDKAKLLALPFSYVEPRHRLGLLDEDLEKQIVAARRNFREHLPPADADAIEFYDADRYNTASSLKDNILLGRVAYGIAEANERVGGAILEVLKELDLVSSVFEVGLQFNVGTGGKRLNQNQRQQIGLARALLKRPDLIVVNRALAGLDDVNQLRHIRAIKTALRADGRHIGLFWVLSRDELAGEFETVLEFDQGRMVRQYAPQPATEAARAGAEK